MTTLEIRDLHVSVGSTQILNGITLTIKSGEVHAVMGPNGAGKSTLSAAIMGKPGYTVTSGSILLDGKDVTEHFALEYQPIVRAESLFTGQPTSKGIEALAERITGVLDKALNFALLGLDTLEFFLRFGLRLDLRLGGQRGVIRLVVEALVFFDEGVALLVHLIDFFLRLGVVSLNLGVLLNRFIMTVVELGHVYDHDFDRRLGVCRER